MSSNYEKIFCIFNECLKITNFHNEFETMRTLFEKVSEHERSFYLKLPLPWILELQHDEESKYSKKNDAEKVKESNHLRKEGNQLLTAKGTQRNVLGACRLYNDAIFALIDCEDNVEELALSFANRAIALQTFGYYQEAYDDCVCALEYGYPLSHRHKIVMRQAYCALKLGKNNAARTHIDNLQQMTLNDNFQKQLNSLQVDLEALKIVENVETEMQDNEKLQDTGFHEIIDSSTDRGVYMRAKCHIPKNSLIFTEKAAAIVPVNDHLRVCNQCCTTSFIPYPCRKCCGSIVYCSLKCQKENISVHRYECAAYRCKLFAHIGMGHMALRMLLDNGIFSILNHLSSKLNAAEAWRSLNKSGDIYTNNSLLYSHTLRMISHMDKMDSGDIVAYTTLSIILVSYLKHCTQFFEDLQRLSSHCIDWELLIASLILRHIGQAITNCHSLTRIYQTPFAAETTKFYLLNDQIWQSPFHLRRGFLNTFGCHTELAVQNYHYLSKCNHSCIPTFHSQFSGRYLSIFALRDFKKGDEITNCYYSDYRKAKSSYRRKHLSSNYFFDCKCENCIAPDQDKYFNKFHQYRCENKGCGKIFVPKIPDESMEWWLKPANDRTKIVCSSCKYVQRFDWYEEITMLFGDTQDAARRRAFNIFKKLATKLIGLNDARAYIANNLYTEWFLLPNYGITLLDVDYHEIVEMLKYTMEYAKVKSSVISEEYVAQMAFLWDIIALGKHKCSTKEMDEMLFALSIIPDDLKLIFNNYYDDFIKDVL